MKYTEAIDLIRAHYTSEDDFHNVVDRIIKSEEKAGKETSASKLRSTFNRYSGKKRDGYTVKPLHNLTALNKSGSDMAEIRQSNISLKDVIAPAGIINSISESIAEFKHKDKFNKYGLEVSNKIMLSGPPGVGKTWTAQAIAGELNLDLVFVRWDSLISSHLGSTGTNIRKIFEVADQKPIVLFLDELDAAGKERGGSNQEVGEMSRIVINLLQNIDMFSQDSFLVAATNHGHLLDTAIWRRFNVVNMELPKEIERKKLIDYYSKGMPLEIDVDAWIKDTHGMSGAEIRTKIHKEAKKHILNFGKLSLKMA